MAWPRGNFNTKVLQTYGVKENISTVYSSFEWVSDSFWPVYWCCSSDCFVQRVGFSLFQISKAVGHLEPQPKHKHSIYLTDRSLTVFWPALPGFVKKTNCNRSPFLRFSVSNWQNSIDRYSDRSIFRSICRFRILWLSGELGLCGFLLN